MATFSTPSGSALNKESSAQKRKDEDKLREKEVLSSSKRSRIEAAWSTLVSNSQGKPRTLNFDQLCERGIEALICHKFTEAVNFFERALRTRIREEGKPGPELVKTMLKYTDAWFLKGREICESSKTSPADFRAMLNNMTQIITNEILEATPEDESAGKDQIHSIIAEADTKTSCSPVMNRLPNKTKRMLNDSVVPDPDDDQSVIKTSFDLSDMFDKKADLDAGCSTKPSTNVDMTSS